MRSARAIVILGSALCSLFACRVALADLGWMPDIRTPRVAPGPAGNAGIAEIVYVPMEETLPALGITDWSPTLYEIRAEGFLWDPGLEIPTGYYCAECQQPNGMSVFLWLEMLDLGEYDADNWDCSERSAYVEWLLENCGHTTRFLHYSGHVSIIVEIEGQWYIYETQYNGWVEPPPQGILGTREDIYEISGKERWLVEDVDWWVTRPELVGMDPRDRLRSE